MVVENDFIPFATGGGANVLTPSTYAANAQTSIGQQPGIATSALNNTALRQATYIAACVAQFLANTTGQNVLDDGNMSEVLNTMSMVWPGPTGSVLEFAGATAPTGYLMADGTSYLRSAYPNLFAVIGTTFGSVDGTHFNVPNRKGLFARGAGTQTVSGISYVGGSLGAVTADMLQGHYHSGIASFLDLSTGTVTGTYDAATGVNALKQSSSLVTSPSTDGANGTPRTGVETKPVSIAMNFIIKT